MNRQTRVPDVMARKGGAKLTMLTAYDAVFARLADEAGVDMILVGDSLAMVALGQPDTLGVGMDAMVHHTKAVASATHNALVVGDMPFLSYQQSDEAAVSNAGRFLAEGRAQAVKLEGGARVASRVRAIAAAEIPVMGHLGLTPQSVAKLGGFKVQAKTADAAEALIDEARMLEDAGCFAMVLEAIPAPLAKLVTEAVNVPTIGIGAGAHCDGQVLVTQDVLGLFDQFRPKFVKRYAELGSMASTAMQAYIKDVQDGTFPAEKHSFAMPEAEADKLKD